MIVHAIHAYRLIKHIDQSEDSMINNESPETRTDRHVLIGGGGIAGLSLARALKDAGHDPLVIERSREWPMTDIAHYLPANALRALDQLGLGEAVTAAAHPISRQRVTGARGRTLVDLPISSIWGNGGRSAAIRRSALHELLQAETSDVTVRRGTTIAARLRNGTIKLSDGSIEPYDVLVGADGADSVIRTLASVARRRSKPVAGAGASSPKVGAARRTPGTLASPLVAAWSPCRWATGQSSATPTSPATTAGRRATGATTSTISARRSLICSPRAGTPTPPQSLKLINPTHSWVGPS